jgi:sortase A
LAKQFVQATTTTIAPTDTSPSSTVPTITFHDGDVVGLISIPKVGLTKYVVFGVKYKDLAKGPGMFPGSPMPGGAGNLAIAGHRTTSGAPFGDIDKLKVGDKITVTTSTKSFTYSVTGSKVVQPIDVSVIASTDKSNAYITLITCYPKYSSSKRLVVTGVLDTAPDPTAATVIAQSASGAAKSTALDSGWMHDRRAIGPTLLYAVLLMLAWTLTWLWQRTPAWRTRRWYVIFPVAALPTLVLLYFFFENLSRLLPSNI